MAANVVAPPSAFAALLRRSKFASYDPQITQVYTTYGGDAHRGNFGLKRTLANRKRKPYIYLFAIDSPEQQTAWRTAEKRVKWLRKFEEAGCHPDVPIDGPFWQMVGHTGRTQWTLDSDFCLDTTQPKIQSKQSSILNVAAMTPRRFEKYLEQLRKLRPAFQKFINEAAEEKVQRGPAQPSTNSTSLLERSKKSDSLIHNKFLEQCARERIDAPGSHYIEQQLHPIGGLSYTHNSKLQHYFLKKPLPGRMIDSLDSGRRDRGYLVSFAGMTAQMLQRDFEDLTTVDWQALVEQGSDSGNGISSFRMSGAKLLKAPQVVGKRRKDGLELQTIVSSCGKPDMTRPNPHLPWKREFVSHISDVDMDTTQTSRRAVGFQSLRRKPIPRKFVDVTVRNKAADNHLLDTLQNILEKDKR